MSFHSRILLAFVGLIVLVLLGACVVMYIAAQRNGLGLAEQQLRVADRVLEKALLANNQQIRARVAAVVADSEFREAVASRHNSIVASALEAQRSRLHADVFALIEEDGSISASAGGTFELAKSATLQQALHQARLRNTAPTFLSYRGNLLQIALLPVKAPELVGWACAGFLIGDDFAQQVKDTSGAEISLLSNNNDERPLRVAASTLPLAARRFLQETVNSWAAQDAALPQRLGDESFLTMVTASRQVATGAFAVVLQIPMAAVAAPLTALGRDMLMFGGGVTIISLVAAMFGARMLAEPVHALSIAARSLSMSKRRSAVARGDDELAHVARAFHALARRAHYDGLTGLPNRVLLNVRLKEALERTRRLNGSLAVVFIDLNGFKKINDTLGHEMGDLVLRKTAQRLARSIPASNTVARLGGDEFVVVLEQVDQTEAVRTVDGLAKIIGRSMASPSGPINVGMSAGIAMCPALAVDPEELLQLADAAMYMSKTRKAGPVLAARAAATTPSPASTEPTAADSASETSQDDTVSTDVWKGRDLVTQSTKAVSAIIGPKLAEIPPDERERLSALHRLRYLDKPPRASFDRITRLAARSLNVPIALVSLVDENRQWFLSRVGLDATETPRDISFCAHAIFERKPLIVPDATRDDRFRGNPLVTDDPRLRAYAGLPVFTPKGFAIGTLCVADSKPRAFAETDLHALQDLAHIIEDIIRIREFTLIYEKRQRQKRSQKTSGLKRAPERVEFNFID